MFAIACFCRSFIWVSESHCVGEYGKLLTISTNDAFVPQMCLLDWIAFIDYDRVIAVGFGTLVTLKGAKCFYYIETEGLVCDIVRDTLLCLCACCLLSSPPMSLGTDLLDFPLFMIFLSGSQSTLW